MTSTQGVSPGSPLRWPTIRCRTIGVHAGHDALDAAPFAGDCTSGRCSMGNVALSPVQQPTASLSVRQTCAMRGLESNVTRRRKDARGTVWRLSKLTTHGVGTPSALGVSSSSDTKPRRVLVRAATTTDPMRSATGSRVNTSTGRSPPGVAANQISPRCIVPVGPILGWPPV